MVLVEGVDGVRLLEGYRRGSRGLVGGIGPDVVPGVVREDD